MVPCRLSVKGCFTVVVSSQLQVMQLDICIHILFIQHHGIFKRKHQGSVGKQVCTCQFTIPEVKIIFVLLYWLVLTILIWGTFSIRDGRIDTFNYHLQNYINCMAGGSRKDQNCQELRMSLEAESQVAPTTAPPLIIHTFY